jgi:Flp pilus assembly protein TadB
MLSFLYSSLCFLIIFFGGIIALIVLQLYWVAITCLSAGIVIVMAYMLYLLCQQPKRSQQSKCSQHFVPAGQIRIVQQPENIVIEEKYETNKRESKM